MWWSSALADFGSTDKARLRKATFAGDARFGECLHHMAHVHTDR